MLAASGSGNNQYSKDQGTTDVSTAVSFAAGQTTLQVRITTANVCQPYTLTCVPR
jgi:hypothetical protein